MSIPSWLAQGIVIEVIGAIVEIFVIVALVNYLMKRREAKRSAVLRGILGRNLRRAVDRALQSLHAMSRIAEQFESSNDQTLSQ